MQKDFLQEQIGQTQTQNREEEFRCKHCGAILTEEDMFCPECGEKVDGEEKTCPVCATTTTSEFCPECGYRIIPAICPECGNECHYDLCEKCGAVINPVYEQAALQQIEDPVAMSKEEVHEIEKVFAEQKSQKAEEFIERVEKHQRQQKIKAFVTAREKRIVKVFGKSPVEYVIPNLEEEAFMMKAYEELSKVVKARDEEKKEKELKMEFYEISKETQKKYEEMQARSKQIIAGLEKDIKDAAVLEKKLLEEEQRRIEEERRIKAEEEAKKRKAEELARINSILGRYEMFYKYGRSEIYIKSFKGEKFLVYARVDFYSGGHLLRTCSATLRGNNFHMHVEKFYKDCKTDGVAEKSYNGELAGTIITGFWDGCSRSKYFKID